VRPSRRRFLRLLAAGSAAAAATPAATLARAAAPRKPPAAAAAKPAPPPAGAVSDRSTVLAEGIRRQKAAVEDSLRTLRAWPLPPGSEPGFVFAPLKPRRRPGSP